MPFKRSRSGTDLDPDIYPLTLPRRNTMNNYHYMLMAEPKYPKRFYGYTAQLRDENSYRRYGKTWNMAAPDQRMNRVTDNYVGAGKYRRVRRSPRRVKGRGIYTGNFAGQGSYLNRMMNRQMNRTFAGQTPLGALGKKIGRRALGAVEGVVTGQGMYDLNDGAPASNNLVAGGGLSVPTFSTQADETGALIIQHQEYVKDIYGVPWVDPITGNNSNDPATAVISQPFKNDSLPLNPGLATTFPWLSQIAANYEEYELLQLMFCFKTRVGDNLTTTDGQVGTLLMFTDYNATDPPRRTKQDMLQGYGTSVSKISDSDIIHGIECDPSKIKGDAHKFVRTGGSSQDLHDFDWGLFQIAVDNTPAVLSNKVIGELYVSYTVKLSKPRLYAQLGHAIQQDQILCLYSKAEDGAAIHSGSVLALGVSNSIGCKVSPASGAAAVDYKVTLPGGFSGAFECLVIVDQQTTLSALGVQRIELEDISGNVSTKKDFVVGDMTLSAVDGFDADPAPGTTVSFGGSGTSRLVSVFHLTTTMAAFGVDNTFTIRVRSPALSGVVSNKVLLNIRRYNSLDRVGADEFITAEGNKFIIPSN
jgi:hypothetical protein